MTFLGESFADLDRRRQVNADITGISNVNRGFNGSDDLSRLEATAANELPGALGGLTDQLQKIGRTEDRVGEEAAVEKASIAANRSSDLDKEQFERATRGLDLSPRQQRSAGRRIGLARSLNRARAAGTTRRDFTDQSKLASRVRGSFGDALFGQRIGAQTDLAAAEAARQQAEDTRSANKKAAKIGTIGKIGGAILGSIFSSEELKNKQGATTNLLDKLKKVRVEKWNYKGATRRHIGPFAEEFNDTFEVNQDNRGMINVIDALGVTLGAVKELDRKVEAHA